MKNDVKDTVKDENLSGTPLEFPDIDPSNCNPVEPVCHGTCRGYCDAGHLDTSGN